MKTAMIICNKVRNDLKWIGPRIVLPILLAFGSAAGFLPVYADSVTNKSDRFLQAKAHADRPGFVNVIVRMEGDFTSARADRLRALQGVIYSYLPIIHSVVLRIPTGQLNALANLPFVARLSEDVITQKHDEFTVASTGADVAFQQVGVTGSGVTVAVLDSGIKYRPDLNSATGNSRILTNVNFVPNENNTEDACGHGTHVAGLIAGNGAMSTGNNCYRTFLGIARNANLVNVRVLDSNGLGQVSTVISGIQWCIANKAAYNIRVINLSLGHPVGESYTTDPLCQAVEQAWQSGIVVVCAAGNGGRLNTNQSTTPDNEGWGTAYGSIQSPANAPCVITVGAMKSVDGIRAHDRIATYSGRGPTSIDTVLKPDIVAPGNRVISLRNQGSMIDSLYGTTNTIPLNYYMTSNSYSDTPQYFRLSGTSMAAPVVSGAAALLLQADPSLTPDTIKARLMVSADKWSFPGGLYDPCTFGAGYLNIPAALSCSVVASQPALSPSLIRDSADNVFLNQILWGNQFIWGTEINDLSIIWGTQIIWGTNVISNMNVSWGVQGSQIIWGKYEPTPPPPPSSVNTTSLIGEN